MIRILSLLLLFLPLSAGEPDPIKDLKQSQKDIILKYQRDLEQAKIEYYQKINTLRTNTYELVNLQIQEITKQGNPESALTTKYTCLNFINSLKWWEPPTIRNNRNIIIYSPTVDKDLQTVNITLTPNNNSNTNNTTTTENTGNNTTLPEKWTEKEKIENAKILVPKDVIGTTKLLPNGTKDLIVEFDLYVKENTIINYMELQYKSNLNPTCRLPIGMYYGPKESRLTVMSNNKFLNNKETEPAKPFLLAHKPQKFTMILENINKYKNVIYLKVYVWITIDGVNWTVESELDLAPLLQNIK